VFVDVMTNQVFFDFSLTITYMWKLKFSSFIFLIDTGLLTSASPGFASHLNSQNHRNTEW